MAHHDHHRTVETKDSTHLAIVDRAGCATGMSENVDALVVECYAFQALNVVLPKVAYDTIVAGDRHRQASLIGFKSAAHHAIDRRELS